MMMAIAAGWFSVAAWVYLLLARGMFWRETHRCSTWNNCGKAQNRHEASVVAIVPARNERATVGRCVSSLLGQKYGGTLRVIVVDDQSEDGTAEVATQTIKPGSSRAPDLTVIRGRALPEGWSGKVWAMQQGVEAARELHPDFFLFTDADVVHALDNLATLVTIAEDGGYDLTSFMVRLHCESVAERLLIPAFVFFFFMLYPPRWIADPRKKTAGAAGGCMLVRPQALERGGGLQAIREEVIDDCALARVMKTPGATSRVWLGLSEDTVSVREYGSFREVGRMIARSAFNQLHHSALMLAGALVGMAITFLAPITVVLVYPTLAKTGLGWATQEPWVVMALGGAAWAMMTLAYLPMVRFYRLHLFWAVTLPLAASFYMGATVWSAVKFWLGQGGEWKGRAQDV